MPDEPREIDRRLPTEIDRLAKFALSEPKEVLAHDTAFWKEVIDTLAVWILQNHFSKVEVPEPSESEDEAVDDEEDDDEEEEEGN